MTKMDHADGLPPRREQRVQHFKRFVMELVMEKNLDYVEVGNSLLSILLGAWSLFHHNSLSECVESGQVGAVLLGLGMMRAVAIWYRQYISRHALTIVAGIIWTWLTFYLAIYSPHSAWGLVFFVMAFSDWWLHLRFSWGML